MKRIKIYSLLIVSLILSGCAAPKPMYNWGPYEPQVYEFFKGESPDKQIQILEAHLKETESKGEKIPPGFYAHLGLLYAKAGKDAEFRTMLDLEKQHYPESSAYINNLNKNFKK